MDYVRLFLAAAFAGRALYPVIFEELWVKAQKTRLEKMFPSGTIEDDFVRSGMRFNVSVNLAAAWFCLFLIDWGKV